MEPSWESVHRSIPERLGHVGMVALKLGVGALAVGVAIDRRRHAETPLRDYVHNRLTDLGKLTSHRPLLAAASQTILSLYDRWMMPTETKAVQTPEAPETDFESSDAEETIEETLPSTESDPNRETFFTFPSPKHPERNEDSAFTTPTSMGVFDGLSGSNGYNGGDVASKIAMEITLDRFGKMSTIISPARAKDHLAMTLKDINKAVHDEANRTGYDEMATTGAIMKYFRTEAGTPYAAYAHTGDSRIYLFRDGSLRCLTVDHGYVRGASDPESLQEKFSNLIDKEEITDAQERYFYLNRNVVFSQLGGRELREPTIDVDCIELEPGDIFIATTDGVHDNLTKDELQAMLSAQMEGNVAAQIIGKTAFRRSQDVMHPRHKLDDITVAVRSYTGPEVFDKTF